MPHTVGAPPPVSARQGREQQKYTEDGARCVAGCIPVRYGSDPTNPGDIQVLMISSRNGKGFVFPKGGWEVDESVEIAALRETVEEAGVRGELELPMLGTFEFRSGKGKGRCVAYVFAVKVSEELEQWPEAGQRERVWCSIEESYQRARYDWMREAILAWVTRNGWQLNLVHLHSSSSLASDEIETPSSENLIGIGNGEENNPRQVSPETPVTVQN